ncbi:AAA family ATPase [Streptomyces sp. NRRL B-24484]|uniref:AAA family ATPase n=1 Tax=Streptomyces sp. NRRL B-24484 TaxID=1463833 RepID=UPI0004C0B01F|nr:SMC family ATPase [Streptomyces sp. NRRL B-24484]
MRLHHLSLQAFGPFRTAEEVDFDRLAESGLFLFHGATGAGKSTVFEAVCFALYGSVPGTRHPLSLRSHHADPGTATKVELEFTMAGRRLRIVRTPQQEKDGRATPVAATAHLWQRHTDASSGAEEWRPVSSGHQETNGEITALLGMSREQFCQVVLLPQGEFARFLRSDAKERGAVLSRLFGTHRFTAVQRWLADHARETGRLRDEARDAVWREADRIQHAAATAGITTTAPTPSADTPELTPAQTLHWARELHAAADATYRDAQTALATARAEHSAATRHAEATRALAERQHRHRVATTALADLRARADHFEELAGTVDLAARAEPVRALLNAADAADREHTTAAEAADRARQDLPEPHTRDGDADLATAENRLTNDIGQLEALRPEEQRAADLAAELARLDAELEQAEADQADVAEWLQQADARRAEHTARLEAAQRAHAEATRLGATLPQLTQRLEAARQRDALADTTAEARAEAEALKKAAHTARERAVDLLSRRLEGMAGELAGQLEPGRPCPVCGSPAHPAPATAAAGHPTREEAAQADEEFEAARRAAQAAELAVSTYEAQARSAEEVAGGAATADLARALDDAERTHTDLLHAAAEAAPAEEQLRQFDGTRAERTDELVTIGRRIADYRGRREARSSDAESLGRRLADALAGHPTVTDRIEQLAGQRATVTAARTAVGRADTAAATLARARRHAEEQATDAGFASLLQAREALLPRERVLALTAERDAWQTEQTTQRATVDDPAVAAAARQEAADAPAADTALAEATERLTTATTTESTTRRCCEALAGHLDALTAHTTRLGPLAEEHARARHLAELAAGTSTDNQLRMHLEAYVLAARLEDVARAANTRLKRMSSGRYLLSHTDARTGRGRSGLSLEILDQWTGRTRDTKTLSGGESFFASLSLALGLADVVAHEAGGSRLDTLFIDEGFGSLDEVTLDEVLQVLDELRSHSRAVGVVSHVGDLRRRIPTQMHVRKSENGSTIRALDHAPAH